VNLRGFVSTYSAYFWGAILVGLVVFSGVMIYRAMQPAPIRWPRHEMTPQPLSNAVAGISPGKPFYSVDVLERLRTMRCICHRYQTQRFWMCECPDFTAEDCDCTGCETPPDILATPVAHGLLRQDDLLCTECTCHKCPKQFPDGSNNLNCPPVDY
jgi:hypothetical protein